MQNERPARLGLLALRLGRDGEVALAVVLAQSHVADLLVTMLARGRRAARAAKTRALTGGARTPYAAVSFRRSRVLDWFGGEASVPELIQRKKYDKAERLLRKEFEAGRRDAQLRLQLADVIALAGRGEEAVPIYIGLADEFARAGHAPKAIAILKKIESLSPGRGDVADRLAALIGDRGAGAAPRRPASTRSGGSAGAAAGRPPEPEFDLELVDRSRRAPSPPEAAARAAGRSGPAPAPAWHRPRLREPAVRRLLARGPARR